MTASARSSKPPISSTASALVKSPAELNYVRKAGELGDAALKAAIRKTRAGADEGEILAAQQRAIFAGGGDYPGNEFIIGSGRDALLCRYKSGRRKLSKRDQLTLELAGVYRHYHAAFMRTIIIGKPTRIISPWTTAAREALAEVEDVMQPGPHRGRRVRRACPGHGRAWHARAPPQCLRLFARRQVHAELDGCADVLPRQSELNFEPGMVFFAHMILMDLDPGQAYCLGRTYIIGDKSRSPFQNIP